MLGLQLTALVVAEAPLGFEGVALVRDRRTARVTREGRCRGEWFACSDCLKGLVFCGGTCPPGSSARFGTGVRIFLDLF
jgi:hypothetical protein